MERAKRRTTAEQIAAAKEEIAEKEKRVKTLLARQKKEDDKARTHRLCVRGGIVEKLLPDLIKLTPEQFFVFADRVLLTNYTKRILGELLPPSAERNEGDAAQGGGVAAITAESRDGATGRVNARRSGAQRRHGCGADRGKHGHAAGWPIPLALLMGALIHRFAVFVRPAGGVPRRRRKIGGAIPRTPCISGGEPCALYSAWLAAILTGAYRRKGGGAYWRFTIAVSRFLAGEKGSRL